MNIVEFLKNIGEDPEREGLKKTPERYEKALKELTSGYDKNLDEVIGEGIFDAVSSDPILVSDIEFSSLCEHHILPFYGNIEVSYVPNKKILGLSKIPRIVDMFAKRLQTQERLGAQIADAIMSSIKPKGVDVKIHAEHMCMKIRGVKSGAKVSTFHSREKEPEDK
ncbi:GTP cyclohydrolase I FolE [Candidatus Peribacteria bacterium]|jgi:GTP cyclohydrolase IA|nr:GTP cyclohydrolase I FolE [Candidatus Peribacteria bacterium]MBT4021617.1 GTP cyclohydrolase I FolE [Candidatus Peribacteria bacterium]MBT4240887.1 GTP cyclohydrolase I FolE [Candidatus Peribacteria bacterium]MBT4474110.1 GTP cyclohydrolase I FolE [Candidatus Peribacteria bacterium]